MLRIQLIQHRQHWQHWHALSDPGTEDALYEIESMRRFAGIELHAVPDETTILNFRRLIEDNNWRGCQSSGLVHTIVTTAAHEADINIADEPLHGKEQTVHADAGYTGADKLCPKKGRLWHIAIKRGQAQEDG
jgi:IS5 family transposase